jgi:beta-xylosidase
MKPHTGTETFAGTALGPEWEWNHNPDNTKWSLDVAGLALLRHFSAYVAVKKAGSALKVVMVNGLAMDGSWNTTSTGTEAASAALSGTTVWLRLNADIRPGSGRQGKFSYSTDGTTFTSLGPAYTMNNSWEFFMGYRYGIFNFATASTGGAVTIKSFALTTP